MWHASIAAHHYRPSYSELDYLARRALDGVGDAQRGEWIERTDRAFHIRRRLAEAEESRVGPVIDIRDSQESIVRWRHACQTSGLALPFV